MRRCDWVLWRYNSGLHHLQISWWIGKSERILISLVFGTHMKEWLALSENTMIFGFEDKVDLLCKRLVNYCNSLVLYCMLLIFVIVCGVAEWGEYAGFYSGFFISILSLEIKLSKESGWNPNDRVNLPNDCACSKAGLTHLQNIYKLWSYMFICYLNSGNNYICYNHHEIKSAYCNKCGTGVEALIATGKQAYH
jgi:hypothetical protein